MSNFLPHPLLTLTFQNTENSSRTHLIDVIFKTQGLERVRSVYEECFLIPRGLKTMHKSSTWGEKWVFLEILWCNVPGEQQICVSECMYSEMEVGKRSYVLKFNSREFRNVISSSISFKCGLDAFLLDLHCAQTLLLRCECQCKAAAMEFYCLLCCRRNQIEGIGSIRLQMCMSAKLWSFLHLLTQKKAQKIGTHHHFFYYF